MKRVGQSAWRYGLAVLLLVLSTSLALVLTRPPSPLVATDRLFEAIISRLLAPVRPSDDNIVIVGITENTLALLPYYSPTDRQFLANVIDALDRAGARAIGLDIVFDRATEPEKDAALLEVIDRAAHPVVLAAIGKDTSMSKDARRFHDTYLGDRLTGLANLPRSRVDNTVRFYFPEIGGKPTFASAIAKSIGITPPTHAFPITWRRIEEERFFPMYPAQLIPMLPPEWLKDKIVLIGTFVPGQDEHQTPVSVSSRPLYGIEIHAHGLAQMIENRVAPANFLPGWAATAIAALVGMGLATVQRSGVFLAALIIGLAGISAAAAAAFSIFGGLLFLPMAPTLSFLFATAGVRFWLTRQERAERQMLGQLFSKFVSEPVLNELLADRDSFLANNKPRPRRLTATVYFSDIAGFTPICERLQPEELVSWLDRYIDTMTDVVAANRGAVLRFMGDGILAAFGAPVVRTTEEEMDNDAQNAVRCALQSVENMRRLNKQFIDENLPTAAIRVGINTGEMLSGSLGSGAHMEYCIQGDVVNTAARLEALGKQYALDKEDSVVLIGEATYARLHGKFECQSVGEVNLKGKEKRIMIYRVLAEVTAPPTQVAGVVEMSSSASMSLMVI